MNKNLQIVYSPSENGESKFHWLFEKEALAMQESGLWVDTQPHPDAESLLYRGCSIVKEEDYPKDERYIHTWKENANYLFMSLYYPLIADLSIETYFVDELGENVVALMQSKGWDKAFIKKDIKALEHIEENKSIYPLTSLEEMKELYAKNKVPGKYAVRKFIEKERLETDLRYWVLNGKIYRRDNIVPDIVKEATRRLDSFGGKYYTIDATPEFIIEVNPGESSDRHAENSAELFASWFKKEFGG